MNLLGALAREFIGCQSASLRVVIVVDFVRFAHWIPLHADLKVRLYERVEAGL